MREPVKRISVMIGTGQYEKMVESKLNISAFIRDLISDHFSEHVVAISVGRETAELYHEVVTNTGATDKDLEPLLREILKKLLDQRLKKIERLRGKF